MGYFLSLSTISASPLLTALKILLYAQWPSDTSTGTINWSESRFALVCITRAMKEAISALVMIRAGAKYWSPTP